MQNIIFRDLKIRKNSLLIFLSILLLLIILYVSIFPAIQAQAAKFNEIIKSLGSVYKAVGIDQQITFKTLSGYMSTELFGFTWPILTPILFIGLASSLVGGEIENKTIGSILLLPVKRSSIMFGKFMTGLIVAVFYSLVSSFGIVLVAKIFSISINIASYLDLFIICLLFSYAIFCFTILVSIILINKARVYGVIGGMLLIMYVLNVISGLKASLINLKYVSLFHYFNGQGALVNSHLDNLALLVLGIIIVLSFILSLLIFSKRDLII